jgi:hypothetical protein
MKIMASIVLSTALLAGEICKHEERPHVQAEVRPPRLDGNATSSTAYGEPRDVNHFVDVCVFVPDPLLPGVPDH